MLYKGNSSNTLAVTLSTNVKLFKLLLVLRIQITLMREITAQNGYKPIEVSSSDNNPCSTRYITEWPYKKNNAKMRDTKIPAFFPLPKKYDKINKRKTVMPIDIKMKGRKLEKLTDSPFVRLKENKNRKGYIAKNRG